MDVPLSSTRHDGDTSSGDTNLRSFSRTRLMQMMKEHETQPKPLPHAALPPIATVYLHGSHPASSSHASSSSSKAKSRSGVASLSGSHHSRTSSTGSHDATTPRATGSSVWRLPSHTHEPARDTVPSAFEPLSSLANLSIHPGLPPLPLVTGRPAGVETDACTATASIHTEPKRQRLSLWSDSPTAHHSTAPVPSDHTLPVRGTKHVSLLPPGRRVDLGDDCAAPHPLGRTHAVPVSSACVHTPRTIVAPERVEPPLTIPSSSVDSSSPDQSPPRDHAPDDASHVPSYPSHSPDATKRHEPTVRLLSSHRSSRRSLLSHRSGGTMGSRRSLGSLGSNYTFSNRSVLSRATSRGSTAMELECLMMRSTCSSTWSSTGGGGCATNTSWTQAPPPSSISTVSSRLRVPASQPPPSQRVQTPPGMIRNMTMASVHKQAPSSSSSHTRPHNPLVMRLHDDGYDDVSTIRSDPRLDHGFHAHVVPERSGAPMTTIRLVRPVGRGPLRPST